MFVAVLAFKTMIGGLFLFWFLSVVMMTQKTMASNRMSIREAGMFMELFPSTRSSYLPLFNCKNIHASFKVVTHDNVVYLFVGDYYCRFIYLLIESLTT